MLTKINQVNTLLQSDGSFVIQQKQVGNQPVMYGYKPQYIIDAVNEVFLPENWYFKLHEIELFATGDSDRSGQIVASVEIFMRASAESEFISHGIQFGESTIVHGNVGNSK